VIRALPAIVFLLAAVGFVPPALATQYRTPLQAPPQVEIVEFEADPVSRMTVPIVINGVTHRFLVDSGSERTGISAELALQLGLVRSTSQLVTGLAGNSWVPTYVVPSMVFARGSKRNVQALAFSRYAIGADGFLGADTLSQQLVEFDFGRNRMSLRKAPAVAAASPLRRSALVDVRLRNGRLVFTEARADRVKIQAILDTGSSISIGNGALRRELARRNRLGQVIPVTILAVTGEPVAADLVVAREVVIGDTLFRNMPIAFATIEPFVELGFVDQPAMLLGMDALRLFERVAIDFRNKRVSFTTKDTGETGVNTHSTQW
jgi:predicted aspartyl protease